MTVWIVKVNYESNIEGVFDSEEKAKDFVRKEVKEGIMPYELSDFDITEYKVE